MAAQSQSVEKERLMAARMLVWEMPEENLRSYHGIIEHFRERKSFEISVRDPKTGETFIYGFNFAIGALTLSTDDRSGFVLICPYKFCENPSGIGEICSHLRKEMLLYNFDPSQLTEKHCPGVFIDGGITHEGIRMVINEICRVRKLTPPNFGLKEHMDLIKSVRMFPFYSSQLCVAVTGGAFSRSLDISDTRGKGHISTCAKEGCYYPAYHQIGVHSYCLDHKFPILLTSPINQRVRSEIYYDVYKTVNPDDDESLTSEGLTISVMKAIYRHLWECGSTGYFYEKNGMQVLLKMEPNRTISFTNLLGVYKEHKYVCTWPGCLLSAKHPKPSDTNGKLFGNCRCEEHKYAADDTPFKATLDNIVYGDKDQAALCSRRRMSWFN